MVGTWEGDGVGIREREGVAVGICVVASPGAISTL
jgi:hypothetical protein